jgi:hypothetical protein
MRLDGLVEATNDILKLGRKPSASDLHHVCDTACRELTIMSDDDAFHALLEAQTSEHNPEVRRVLDELSSFGAFLQEELRLLITAGVDASAAEALLEETRNFRQTLSGMRMDRTALRVGLYQVRNEVCSLSNLFADASADDEGRRKARVVLRRAAWVIGGAVIVVVNTTATSLTAVYAGVSVSLGTSLIGHGIRGG